MVVTFLVDAFDIAEDIVIADVIDVGAVEGSAGDRGEVLVLPAFFIEIGEDFARPSFKGGDDFGEVGDIDGDHTRRFHIEADPELIIGRIIEEFVFMVDIAIVEEKLRIGGDGGFFVAFADKDINDVAVNFEAFRFAFVGGEGISGVKHVGEILIDEVRRPSAIGQGLRIEEDG